MIRFCRISVPDILFTNDLYKTNDFDWFGLEKTKLTFSIRTDNNKQKRIYYLLKKFSLSHSSNLTLNFSRNSIMLNRCVPTSLRQSFTWIVARQLSLSTSLAQQSKQQQQATDPIQQLFVNKIREYNEKRK